MSCFRLLKKLIENLNNLMACFGGVAEEIGEAFTRIARISCVARRREGVEIQ